MGNNKGAASKKGSKNANLSPSNDQLGENASGENFSTSGKGKSRNKNNK